MEQSEEEKKIRLEAKKLRELFNGRFKQDEMEMVVREMGGLMQALDFLMTVRPDQVSGFLRRSPEFIEKLRLECQDLNAVLESGEAHIESTKRQFACKPCERSWWRKVPLRKEVSKCLKCDKRYEAIPREKEWGWGQFYCDGEGCGVDFQGFGVMGMTKSMCHRCGFYIPVDHIIPPNKFSRNKARKTRDTHDCNGVNCYRRVNMTTVKLLKKTILPDGTSFFSFLYLPDRRAVCIHPKSKHLRPPDAQYRTWSSEHRSTGSTISTFMDQQSVFSGSGSFAYSIPHGGRLETHPGP
ncbi:hypothetical protein Btru_061705 [Bulinus truncatus]|nr:hypothetical protein Btru_061705 [Bulinus truncatus]